MKFNINDTPHAVPNETPLIELTYPSLTGQVSAFEIGLVCVRAADNIRVSFDYERDGWRIEQQAGTEDEHRGVQFMGWQEVAFIKAWGSIQQEGDT